MLSTEEKKERTRSMRDLVEVIFRHRRKALAFFLAVTFSSVIVLAFAPGSYTSTAKLIVHRGRESVFVDPSAVGAMLPLYKEWENEINTELEILNSRELVSEVVKSMGSAVFLDEGPPDETGRLGPIRKVLNPVRLFFQKLAKAVRPAGALEEDEGRQKKITEAIQIVEKGLTIDVRPKSDIITVSYDARDPELSRQVVSEIVASYLERRVELHQIPGGYQFFTQQAELLRKELEENSERMFEIKKEKNIDSIDGDSSALRVAIGSMNTSRLRVQSERVAAKARVDAMYAMLSQQSAENSNALMDPVEYKKLQAALRLEESALAAWIAQDHEIGRQLNQLWASLRQFEKSEPEIRRLKREQELLEEKYRKYSENREQARINQELETRKISNVTIVQHATLPDEANPHGKLAKLAASLFLGLCGALGMAFGADLMDPRLYSEADVVTRLRRETLMELPRLHGKELDPAYCVALPRERKTRRILHSGNAAGTEGDTCFQELLLRFLAMKPRAPVIGLTGSTGGEGVSTVAGKLAAAFSRDERFSNVLLLDANLTEHSVQQVRQRTDLPFIYQKVRSEEDADEGCPSPVNASTVAQYLARARQERYDVIIVDIPPVEEGSYAVRVAAQTDLIGLLVDCGHTPWRAAKRSADLLDHAGATPCRIILNRQKYTMPKWLYKKL
ncbi:MAG TPA: Wzz/FepE/Etk N-terminal domain-containing protein [Tichowtungia sp.]|nr:Wzz/FepE/Etk N-terminal domain-containing protein [Tichowtungia sp.]